MTDSPTVGVNPSPCSSCPYRTDTPPGVWHPDEYDKLVAYDNETFAQPPNLFLCHHHGDPASPSLCSGWVHVHGFDLLAVRLGIAHGEVDAEQIAGVLDDGAGCELYDSGTAARDAASRDTLPDESVAVANRLMRNDRIRETTLQHTSRNDQ